MTTLTQVLSELFRSFGYTGTHVGELEGLSGRRHAVPLILEKDSRRLAVTVWAHRQPLGPSFVQEFTETIRDTGCDGGLIASLGASPEILVVQAAKARIHVWDSRRIAQELGEAVLGETVPDVWQRNDPLVAGRPSRLVERVHESTIQNAPPTTTPVAATDPVQEPPFPTEIPTVLAAEAASPSPTLEVPAAFGLFDSLPTVPPTEPGQTTLEQASTPVEPAPAPPTTMASPPPPPTPAPSKPVRRILRVQVAKGLAASMAKPKTRSVDRIFLRLTPHYVFDYEAQLLVEGSLNSEKRQGRLAIDASMKKVRPWAHALETGDLPSDAADIDEKPVRMPEADARTLAVTELKGLVTRDVVHEEDGNEWSVVVKKRVELAEDELRVESLGIHWTPVWRITGRDGTVEIDATTGQFLHEEISVPRSDALLI